VVKKIADEHRATVRIANLHAADEADGVVTGARVSLSFPQFVGAASPAAAEPRPADEGGLAQAR
jgi:nitrogen fixation/metabolism regulation signal transduction histidine kinase